MLNPVITFRAGGALSAAYNFRTGTRKRYPVFLFLTFLFFSTCLHDTPSEYYVRLAIQGFGSLTVDWGDGTQKTAYTIYDNNLSINHWLSGSDKSTIKINGDDITYLEIEENGLTGLKLDLSGCTGLKSLNFRYDSYRGRNPAALDVSGCTALEALYCYGTLKALEVNGCTALRTLYCYGTALTDLDVRSCTALRALFCYETALTVLDVSGCSVLEQLDCSRSKLSAIDLDGCSALERLNCGANELTTLDVSSCTALQTLDCYGNKLDSNVLDALFGTLPAPGSGSFSVFIYGNPGADSCNRTLAEDKGWRVIG